MCPVCVCVSLWQAVFDAYVRAADAMQVAEAKLDAAHVVPMSFSDRHALAYAV